MFDHDTNSDETVSRRNVLETARGLVAGSTVLAGFGAGRGAAESEEGLQVEVQEMTEEYIAVRVGISEELYERINERGALAERVFLDPVDRFVIHDEADAVSLPEETDGLADPVESNPGDPGEYRLHFRTEDLLPKSTLEQGEGVTLGLGVFTERTIPRHYWDSGTVAVDVTCPEC